jgi:hypothetical protein
MGLTPAPTGSDGAGGRRKGDVMGSSGLRRYLPVFAVVVVVALVALVLAVRGGSSDDEASLGTGEGGGYRFQTQWGPEITLPAGVIPFSVARAEGLEVDWPASCDTERGSAAVPSYFAPDCYAPFTGDNGGATAQGVTSDAIKVVLYEGPDNDAILSAIAGAVTDDKPADVTATYKAFLPYFEQYYETYGRKVDLVVYKGKGNAIDEVAARAAATEIAEDIKPFAVWGGPAITTAFSDELASRGILNFGGSGTPEYFKEKDPYLFGIAMGAWQMRQLVAEYVGKRLAGEAATYAGDPRLAAQERRFGLVYLDSGTGAVDVADSFAASLSDVGVDIAATATYRNPLDVTSEAPGIIARMKDAGVTTVMLVGDPLTPATFTRVATDQDWFPEWLMVGSPLVDTTVYSRTYDQRQWASAFGLSSLYARSNPQESNGRRLFRWFTCSEPAATDYIELIYPVPAVFFSALQGAGPNLSAESFRTALFNANPTRRAIGSPSLSWGTPEKGRWSEVDYQGVDDVTELWWDAEATGPDENGRAGAGMWSYVDGGKRYLPGEIPDGAPKVFSADGSVTLYERSPEADLVSDYPSPCGG